MPIRTVDNQYRGVNAHLHSYFQQQGDWTVFHGLHITHLSEALQALLPPESGYVALPEKSVQITRKDLSTGSMSRIHTIPDVGVYKTRTESDAPLHSHAVAPGAVIDLVDTLLEQENIRGVVIREVEEGELGKIVTRIEVLSPTNKPPRQHAYLEKRDETLLSGINMVELDYLHEARSQLEILPDYPNREPNAYPYVITVSSPYPSPDEGKAAIYGFRVDDPIPTVTIPLKGDDTVMFDLGAVYNHTFRSHFVFGLTLVDYEQLPLNFEAYDAEDQRRIRAVMERAAAVAQQP